MMVNVGYGNIVNSEKIVAVIAADTAPSKRMIANARENNLLVDATSGRKTQGIIVTDSHFLILSALLPETLMGRINGEE